MGDDASQRAGGGWLSRFLGLFEQVAGDVAGLRRVVRKQGHAAEMRHEELGERLQRLEASLRAGSSGGVGSTGDPAPATLTTAQLESLCQLDESLTHLLRAESAEAEAHEAPASAEEALAMVQVRVRNLQRSFGLEAVRSVGERFDDRLHRVHAATERDDVGDGVVVEELRPGYVHGERVVRPALVVVNRRR